MRAEIIGVQGISLATADTMPPLAVLRACPFLNEKGILHLHVRLKQQATPLTCGRRCLGGGGAMCMSAVLRLTSLQQDQIPSPTSIQLTEDDCSQEGPTCLFCIFPLEHLTGLKLCCLSI
jgi:hypothetical protein